MELKNLIIFSSVQSSIARDLIYQRMWEAAQRGENIQYFTYNKDELLEEDKEYLERQRLTLLKKYGIIE